MEVQLLWQLVALPIWVTHRVEWLTSWQWVDISWLVGGFSLLSWLDHWPKFNQQSAVAASSWWLLPIKQNYNSWTINQDHLFKPPNGFMALIRWPSSATIWLTSPVGIPSGLSLLLNPMVYPYCLSLSIAYPIGALLFSIRQYVAQSLRLPMNWPSLATRCGCHDWMLSGLLLPSCWMIGLLVAFFGGWMFAWLVSTAQFVSLVPFHGTAKFAHPLVWVRLFQICKSKLQKAKSINFVVLWCSLGSLPP